MHNNLNNLVYDKIFHGLNNKNLLSASMTSKDMMMRVKSYLKRSGRHHSLKLLELAHKLNKDRKESKHWSKRPKNNNNSNSSSGSSVRRLSY